ncbi:MAG: hypothetical protein U0136_00010 [Bdellovibrionota bacterium]
MLFALLVFSASASSSNAEDSPAPSPASSSSSSTASSSAPSAAPSAAPLPVASPPDDSENDGKIVVATPVPSGSAPRIDENGQEVVEPLDVWIPAQPSPSPAKSNKPAALQPEEETEAVDEEGALAEEGEEVEEEPVQLESVETDAQLPEDAANKAALQAAVHPRRIQLTKYQRKRMNAARAMRRKIVREQRKELHLDESADADPRGEPELTLCTLNVNNYGARDDYRRIFKAAKLPLRKQAEDSMLRAVGRAKCDVIATQCFLGADDAAVEKGMSVLKKKLSAQTGSEWVVRYSPSNRDIVRNAFLVRKESAEIVRTDSFGTVKFNMFSEFTGTQFARMPFEIVLHVPGKGKSSDRTLLLIAYDFRNSFGPNEKEPETLRMQMADALRQIVHTETHKFPNDDPPIVVILGDRRGPKFAPATQLLEGRSRLVDFTENGGCSLDETATKTICKAGVVHYKEFFGVSAEGLGQEPQVVTKKVDGVEKKMLVYPSESVEKKRVSSLARLTSEIYFQARDLDWVMEKPFLPGRYRAGTVRVSTGLPQSPLVWAELNW